MTPSRGINAHSVIAFIGRHFAAGVSVLPKGGAETLILEGWKVGGESCAWWEEGEEKGGTPPEDWLEKLSAEEAGD